MSHSSCDMVQPKICHCARLNWTLSDKGAEFVDDCTLPCNLTRQCTAQSHSQTHPTHTSDSANCHGYKINIPLHGYTGTNASEPGNQREGFELWMTSPNMVFNLTISEGGEYEMAMVTIIILQLPPTRTCVLASAQYSQHTMCAALSGLQLPWPSG